MRIGVVVLFMVGWTFSFSQHNLGLSSSLNRFDVFTSVDYNYTFNSSLTGGVSIGTGAISLLTTGNLFLRTELRTGYSFKIKENIHLIPSYFYSFLVETIKNQSDLYNEHQIGYQLRIGEKIQGVNNCMFGMGRFKNQSVNSRYFAFCFTIGLSYVF